jgi:hypothetical protein
MPEFFSFSARGFITTVLIAGGGVTQADSEVPATAMVTTPADVVDGSVPAVSAEPPAGTSSPANSALTTFWCLGSGGEAEGLQNRQCKHSTTPRFDNSTRQQLHTWGVRLLALYVCALPDDPEGLMARLLPTPRMIQGSCSSSPSLWLPSLPGSSRFRSSRRWAEHQLFEPFSLQPQRWEEGSPVGGCPIVVDNSGTMLCIPAEVSQLVEVLEQQNLFQVVKNLPALEDFALRTTPGCRAPC